MRHFTNHPAIWQVRISPQSRIFSPANLRTARHELPGYGAARLLALRASPVELSSL